MITISLIWSTVQNKMVSYTVLLCESVTQKYIYVQMYIYYGLIVNIHEQDWTVWKSPLLQGYATKIVRQGLNDCG